MKKIVVIIVCVSISAAANCLGAEPLANEDKSGLYARSIEYILRLDAEEVDLATAVLIISEQWNDNVYGKRYVSKLDDMAIEIRDILKDKKLTTNHKAVAVINQYLFEKEGFKPVPEAADPNDLFLHSVLDRKRGYCLSLSILYLCLAERLGLPLYGVVVPGHFFVRYDDGRVRFNIETTSKGGYADDNHYITKFKVPQGNDDGIYMANLNKLQTLGCFFNNLGNSYNDIGNTGQALVALERAVQINPSLSESRVNLGNIYLKNGRPEDAIYQYKAALRTNPDDAKVHNGLGNAYIEQDWLNDAIHEYRRAVSLDPNFADAYRNLAAAYCKRQTFALAIPVLKQAIALEPAEAESIKQLGDVYRQKGNLDSAILRYKEALRLKSDLAEAHFGLGICYNRMGLADDGIRAYKKALAIKPDMTAALVNLGNVYFARENYDQAITYYKNAARLQPDETTTHYNLAAAYSNSGFYEQAADEYLKVIEIEPQMADAHNGLAFAYYKLKKYGQAAQHIKTAGQLGAEVSEKLLKAIEDKIR